MKSQTSAVASAGKNILLVDDVPHGTIARKSVLMELGYRVETAESGHQALEHLARGRFDLMVTDFKMPGMDGLELIRLVKQVHPGMKIVLLSGLAETLGFTEEITGADAVLVKSSTELNQLTRTVKNLLSRKPTRKPVRSLKRGDDAPPLFMVKSS